MQYFNDYANHFNLYGHIRFQSQVISVQKKGLSWAVLVRDRLGHHHKMFFDAVLVCSGQFWKPTYPNFPGILLLSSPFCLTFRSRKISGNALSLSLLSISRRPQREERCSCRCRKLGLGYCCGSWSGGRKGYGEF